MNELKLLLKRLICMFVAWRMRARGVVVGERLIARQTPFIRCHPGSTIQVGDDCIIHNSSRQNVAGIMHRTLLSTTAVGARIEIGRNVGISGVIFVATELIRIEDDVKLGANVKIYDTDFHPMDFHARMRDDQDAVRHAPVIVRRGAWIGADALLLKGADIGEYAIVGARSVVTGSVPRCCVYAGNPAKLIKKLPEFVLQ